MATQEIDHTLFANLHDATRRYRLHDSTMSNAQLAMCLDLEHHLGDHQGMPNCCFYQRGLLVAIRTKQDELAIFHMWQSSQRRAEKFGDRIPDAPGPTKAEA